MNVLYTSQKLHELFCDDSLPNHAHASGDGDGVPGRCCRLCGGDNNLRYFGDTYVWQGVEERYDYLLNDCFGVKVTSSDCMICEWCVRALRTTGRFRALVHAAFDEQSSDFSSTTLKTKSGMKQDKELGAKNDKDSHLTKPIDLVKRREDRKKLLGVEVKAKRTNIPCDKCKQRYPMLMNARDTYKTFLCSRCKKTGDHKGSTNFCKSNFMMPSNFMAEENLDMQDKADLRGKFREEERKRAHPLPRKISPIDLPKPRSQKYQCSQCSKKYALARQLAMHVRNAHGDSIDNICTVCNQELESNAKLQEHLLQHSGLHQCDECLLIFKNRKTLAAHMIKHHVGYAAS